jgi:cell wall-associated NlpC family hydrolase
MLSKTLLYSFLLVSFVLASCGTSSNSYTDYTKNKSYEKRKNKIRTYTQKSNKPNSSKGTTKEKSNKTRNSSSGYSSMTEREVLVNYAQSLHGINYIYGGKSEMGFDCSGFTSYVYTKQGKALTGNTNMQQTQGRKIALSQAKVGDLLFFGSTQKISHVAIIAEISPNKLVVTHASSSKGVVTQDISNSTYWQPKILYAVDVLSTQQSYSKGGYSKE